MTALQVLPAFADTLPMTVAQRVMLLAPLSSGAGQLDECSFTLAVRRYVEDARCYISQNSAGSGVRV